MVELATSQGEDGYRELSEFVVEDGGVCAETTAKFGIEVVVL